MNEGADGTDGVDAMEPDSQRARRTGMAAHSVVAKLQEMGLPDSLDGELSALSTDLGDLWGAQKELADQLERLVRSEADWSTVGDHLVDLRATVDHISWHLGSVRRPMTKITRYAYRAASQAESAS
jgi:hypothetical protein